MKQKEPDPIPPGIRIPLQRKDLEDLENQDADRRRRLESQSSQSPGEEELAAAVEAMINRSVFMNEDQQIEYLKACIRGQALALRVAMREQLQLKQELQEAGGHLATTERLVAWAALVCGAIGLGAGWLGCLVKMKKW